MSDIRGYLDRIIIIRGHFPPLLVGVCDLFGQARKKALKELDANGGFSFVFERHSSSVNSAAVPLSRNTLWERQFSPRKLPGVRYAISNGAALPFASRLATSRSLPLSTRQTSSL